jgi:DNA-binding transcriptional LysR family regulator
MDRSHLDGLVTFLTVAELGGFRAAAKRLAITPSAVSKTIRALEARLGAPLFSRTTRSVRLTEVGERLLSHVQPAIAMLTAGLEAATDAGSDVGGRLRITAPRAALALLTSRLLPEFLDLYPNIALEIVGEDELVDIVAEGFDAGIRFGLRCTPT